MQTNLCQIREKVVAGCTKPYSTFERRNFSSFYGSLCKIFIQLQHRKRLLLVIIGLWSVWMLSISHTVPSNSINLQELRFQEHNLMISAIVGRQFLAFKETSRVRVLLSKSMIANLILTMIVLRGIVGQWNRRKYKSSEIQLNAIEKALLPPRVPPDPDPYGVINNKKNATKPRSYVI